MTGPLADYTWLSVVARMMPGTISKALGRCSFSSYDLHCDSHYRLHTLTWATSMHICMSQLLPFVCTRVEKEVREGLLHVLKQAL